MEKLIITPKTKIFDLLEAYPQLEEVLTGMAPPFKKLKNPVLRKTVTKITNLSQAAVIGGLKVEELVNQLRKEVGQTAIDTSQEGSTTYKINKPDWFSEDAIVNTMDVRQYLDAGEQPVHEVLASIKKLNKGDILKVTAPFLPAPLIDKSLSMNYSHWLDKKSDEEYHIYFTV